jgi:hypothetical protein
MVKDSLQFIHEKTYRKEWTDYSKTVQSFASMECINTQLVKKVYHAAKELQKKHIREEGTIRKESSFDESFLPPAFLCPKLSMNQCMVGIIHTYFLTGGKKVHVFDSRCVQEGEIGNYIPDKVENVLQGCEGIVLELGYGVAIWIHSRKNNGAFGVGEFCCLLSSKQITHVYRGRLFNHEG